MFTFDTTGIWSPPNIFSYFCGTKPGDGMMLLMRGSDVNWYFFYYLTNRNKESVREDEVWGDYSNNQRGPSSGQKM